jgi:hypothetical protein
MTPREWHTIIKPVAWAKGSEFYVIKPKDLSDVKSLYSSITIEETIAFWFARGYDSAPTDTYSLHKQIELLKDNITYCDRIIDSQKEKITKLNKRILKLKSK